MTKITIRTLLNIDISSIKREADRLGKEMNEGDNDGITKIFFIKPDLNTAQKNVLQTLINKIGTGSVS